MKFSRVEPSYTSKDGCRIVWDGDDEDEKSTVILNKNELDALVELLKKDLAGKIDLEDQISTIFVNSDVTQFNLKDRMFEAKTSELQKEILEYAKVPHDPQYVHVQSKEFYPSTSTKKNADRNEKPDQKVSVKSLHEVILASGTSENKDNKARDLFKIIAKRRSTRKFDKSKVEDWMVDKILAAADVAPTAGNFQGFQVFYVKNSKTKEALVEAANNQPYVNAPIVLVFCMEPSRVKMKFPPEILEKFSLQDATLAAAYSQLAASALGLSSIWIGMIDEQKVKTILGTDLRPSSILCIGYPDKKKPPKSRRKLKELIRVIE